MIQNKKELKDYLNEDAKNYQDIFFRWTNLKGFFINRLLSTPIADQVIIWKYIKTLRYCEYHLNQKSLFHFLFYLYYLSKLRRLSIKTGYQINPNNFGKGLTIYHYGMILVPGNGRIGDYCIIRPGVTIGAKSAGQPVPTLGNNVEICSGVRIIGGITIGDDVVIAPNSVVVNDVPSHSIVAGVPARIIKTRESINSEWLKYK